MRGKQNTVYFSSNLRNGNAGTKEVRGVGQPREGEKSLEQLGSALGPASASEQQGLAWMNFPVPLLQLLRSAKPIPDGTEKGKPKEWEKS